MPSRNADMPFLNVMDIVNFVYLGQRLTSAAWLGVERASGLAARAN